MFLAGLPKLSPYEQIVSSMEKIAVLVLNKLVSLGEHYTHIALLLLGLKVCKYTRRVFQYFLRDNLFMTHLLLRIYLLLATKRMFLLYHLAKMFPIVH